MLIGGAIPALSASFAARGERAPITQAALEAFAIVFACAALAGIVRWIATDGTPAAPGVSLAEAGAHASVWLFAGLLLILCPDRGAQSVRRIAAGALFALACILMAGWVFAGRNPWWGAEAQPAPGWPALNPLALGYLAPALAFAAAA